MGMSQRSIHHAGVSTWTSAAEAQQLQGKAQGQFQLALIDELTCVHTEATWNNSRAIWIEKESHDLINPLPMMTVGKKGFQ